MRYRSLDDLPDVLTIHEAADFMRVSAGVAYEMARRYRATNGLRHSWIAAGLSRPARCEPGITCKGPFSAWQSSRCRRIVSMRSKTAAGGWT